MPAGIKANSDGSAAIQVGGTDVITLTSGGAATFVTSPTTVQAGTAAAPSITFSGDTNTGIYSPGADQVAIATGGSKRFEVDASGNGGLGVTPAAWDGTLTGTRALQLGALGAYVFGTGSGWSSIPHVYVGNNGYWGNGAWRYTSSNLASQYYQFGGQHVWLNAPSGTAGNAITFTQAMTLNASSQLSLNTTVANERFNLYSDNFTYIGMYNSTTGTTSSDGGYIGMSNAELEIRNKENSIISLFTNNTERARITSGGDLFLGATSPIYTTRLSVQNALGADAPAEFRVQGSALSTPATYFIKADNNTATSNVFCRFVINSGGGASGQINANGANAAAFGVWSDERLKENIVDLPPQLGNICALRPVEFDYIESEGGGHQLGFIAQEVQAVYPDLVGERADGMLTLTDLNKNDARLIKAFQELAAKVTALEAEVAALKGI